MYETFYVSHLQCVREQALSMLATSNISPFLNIKFHTSLFQYRKKEISSLAYKIKYVFFLPYLGAEIIEVNKQKIPDYY